MGFFNFKYKSPEEIKPLPRMSDAKLAELIKSIMEGKTIQMIYTGANGWGDMSPRSLGDFLHVFLQPQFDYVNFRVKPEKVIDPLLEARKHGTEMNDKITAVLESHQKHIDNLYSLLLSRF